MFAFKSPFFFFDEPRFVSPREGFLPPPPNRKYSKTFSLSFSRTGWAPSPSASFFRFPPGCGPDLPFPITAERSMTASQQRACAPFSPPLPIAHLSFPKNHLSSFFVVEEEGMRFGIFFSLFPGHVGSGCWEVLIFSFFFFSEESFCSFFAEPQACAKTLFF